MTIIGKQIRTERIINRNTGRTVIVPMDHGISVGPIKGLTNVKDAIHLVSEGGANAIVEHLFFVAVADIDMNGYGVGAQLDGFFHRAHQGFGVGKRRQAG